jgi:hypothetical protein
MLSLGSTLPPALLFFVEDCCGSLGSFVVACAFYAFFLVLWKILESDRDYIESIEHVKKYGHFNNINSFST